MSVASGELTYLPNFVPTSVAPPAEENVNDVRVCVQQLIGEVSKKSVFAERRQDQRFPFTQLIQLTPVDQHGKPVKDLTSTVIGKHISERGLDFFNQHPIAHRRVIVTIESQNGLSTSLLMELSWCRFTKQGWYDNGGRFIEAVENPLG
jgi:hypothetical protein